MCTFRLLTAGTLGILPQACSLLITAPEVQKRKETKTKTHRPGILLIAMAAAGMSTPLHTCNGCRRHVHTITYTMAAASMFTPLYISNGCHRHVHTITYAMAAAGMFTPSYISNGCRRHVHTIDLSEVRRPRCAASTNCRSSGSGLGATYGCDSKPAPRIGSRCNIRMRLACQCALPRLPMQ